MKEQDNTGSSARDLLANERTYLAWIRTGLGLVGFGVVLVKLVRTNRLLAQLGGGGFILSGALVMVYAIRRYREIVVLLSRGRYRAASRGPWLLVMAGLLAAAAALVVVLM